MHEGVLPADDVARGGHQCSQKGWSASETSTVRKPCACAPGVEPSKCTCSSFRRSRSKAIEPLEPLISQRKAFLRPVAKRVASIVPTAPLSKRDQRLDGVVDLAAGPEGRPSSAETSVISPTR